MDETMRLDRAAAGLHQVSSCSTAHGKGRAFYDHEPQQLPTMTAFALIDWIAQLPLIIASIEALPERVRP
jgi:hypothetical protein